MGCGWGRATEIFFMYCIPFIYFCVQALVGKVSSKLKVYSIIELVC